MNPPNASLVALEQRLALLERTSRRRGVLLALCALLLASVPLLAFRSQEGQAPATDTGVLRARGFVLVDDADKARAELSLVKGQPSLALLNEAGVRCAHLSLLDGTQPALIITDAKGTNRISFMVDAVGHPHLLMADSGQKPRIHMAVSERGAGSLMFIHQDGTMPAGLGVHADGRPWQRPASSGEAAVPPKGEQAGKVKDEAPQNEQGR